MDEIRLFSNTRLLPYQYGVIKALDKIDVDLKHIVANPESFINAALLSKNSLIKKYYESNIKDKKEFINKKLNYEDFIYNDKYIEVEVNKELIYQSTITKEEFDYFLSLSFKDEKGRKEEDFFLVDLRINQEKFILKLADNIQNYDKDYLIRKGYHETLHNFDVIEGKRFYFRKGELDKISKKYAPKFYQKLKENISYDYELQSVLEKTPYINNFLINRDKETFINFIEDIAMTFEIDNSILYSLNNYNKRVKDKIKDVLKNDELSLKDLDNIGDISDLEIISIIYKSFNHQNIDMPTIMKKYPVHFLEALYLEII